MNKRVPVAVVAVVALLSLPLITGMLTESHVRQRLASIGSDPVVSAELLSYERGWFTSSARIDLGLSPRYVAQLQAGGSPPGADFLSQRLPVLVEFAHGPLAVRDGVHFGMSKVVAREDPESTLATQLREQLGAPYLFEFRGRAGFGGGLEFDADVPPVNYARDGSDLAFSGLRVDGSLDGNRLVARGEIESIDYENGFVEGTVDAIRVAADYELRPGALALGSADLAIRRAVVSSALLGPDPIFNASELSLRSDVGLDAASGAMRLGLSYGASSVAAGADFALTDAAIGVAVRDLDAAAMQQYYAIMQRAARVQPADPQQILDELEPVVAQLLERGPSLTLDPVRFSLNGEPFSANVVVGTEPAALPSGGSYELADPALWLAYTTLNADATISKRLAETLALQFARTQITAAGATGGEGIDGDELDAMAEAQAGFMLATLAGQGLIEDAGDAYVTSIRFGSGGLTVNGAPVPLGLP